MISFIVRLKSSSRLSISANFTFPSVSQSLGEAGRVLVANSNVSKRAFGLFSSFASRLAFILERVNRLVWRILLKSAAAQTRTYASKESQTAL